VAAMSEELSHLQVDAVLRESDKALLVVIDEFEVWVPKSLIHDDSECYSMKSGPGTLIVPTWWARKEGVE
jgi:hypothetical protein